MESVLSSDETDSYIYNIISINSFSNLICCSSSGVSFKLFLTSSQVLNLVLLIDHHLLFLYSSNSLFALSISYLGVF